MNELRKRRIRSGVITACILAAIGAVVWVVINPSLTGLGGTHKDWFVHVTPENLVEYSLHIVLARYVDEAIHEIPNPSQGYDVVQSHTDVYRRFEVVESLKGDFEPGDTIYVGWSAGYTRIDPETERRQFIPRAVAPLAQGEIYGLFSEPAALEIAPPGRDGDQGLGNTGRIGGRVGGRTGQALVSD